VGCEWAEGSSSSSSVDSLTHSQLTAHCSQLTAHSLSRTVSRTHALTQSLTHSLTIALMACWLRSFVRSFVRCSFVRSFVVLLSSPSSPSSLRSSLRSFPSSFRRSLTSDLSSLLSLSFVLALSQYCTYSRRRRRLGVSRSSLRCRCLLCWWWMRSLSGSRRHATPRYVVVVLVCLCVWCRWLEPCTPKRWTEGAEHATVPTGKRSQSA